MCIMIIVIVALLYCGKIPSLVQSRVSTSQENLQGDLMHIQCLVVVLTIYIVFESVTLCRDQIKSMSHPGHCFQVVLVDTTRNRELYEKDPDIVLEQWSRKDSLHTLIQVHGKPHKCQPFVFRPIISPHQLVKVIKL